MDQPRQTEQERLIELFHWIDTNDNKLISQEELTQFLSSHQGSRLSKRQHKILGKKVAKMKGTDFMNLENFETLLTSPSTRDTLWEKLVVILGDLTTPASRKLEVRTYTDAYTCCPPAIFLILISIVQTIVFAAFANNDKVASILEFYGPLRHQIYRYVSYIFVHKDVPHLTGNIIVQLFCVPCEVVDHWRVWVIYLAGACFGGLSFYIICPDGRLVGASAAVFALLAINMAELIMNWSEMPLRYFRLALYGSYILIHFIELGLTLNWNMLHTETAHIAGLICGILLGLIMVKNLKIEQYEIVIKGVCVILFSVLLCVLVVLNLYNLHTIS
ncbi:hypothetical protein FO519_000308 [Halicephalobus sp. NKZ332]|nr:hypothetical protein FO519_000308 [Halicephalobus sp. NKZ332]